MYLEHPFLIILNGKVRKCFRADLDLELQEFRAGVL